MKALAAGVTCFEVCLFPGNRLSAPVSGSDPELLDLFVCLFLFLLRGFLFFFLRLLRMPVLGMVPVFWMKNLTLPSPFSIHKIVYPCFA